MRINILRFSVLSLAMAGLLSLSGCAAVYRPTGVVLAHYAQDELIPYSLESTDARLAACGTGPGLQQLVGSFGRLIKRPHREVMSAELLSALCSEAKANEAHLLYLRSLHAGNADRAQDANIVDQRLSKVTAERRFAAYHDLIAAYGPLGEDCPSFEYPIDAAQYMIGLLTSVQALLSDTRAGGAVGVPKDVARKAAVSSRCLDNEKWWGVPLALRATVWTSVPGSTPEGKDPWKAMQKAVSLGRQSGMPLAATFYAIAAANQGDTKKEKKAIKAFVSIASENKVPKKYALLAAVGELQVLELSDELWTQKTGRRTPYQGLGSFPGEKQKQESIDVNQFLQ